MINGKLNNIYCKIDKALNIALPLCFSGAKAVGLGEIFNDFTEEEETEKTKKASNYDVTKIVPDHGYYGPNCSLFMYKVKHLY